MFETETAAESQNTELSAVEMKPLPQCLVGCTAWSTLMRNESEPAWVDSSCTIITSVGRLSMTVRNCGWRPARLLVGYWSRFQVTTRSACAGGAASAAASASATAARRAVQRAGLGV